MQKTNNLNVIWSIKLLKSIKKETSQTVSKT